MSNHLVWFTFGFLLHITIFVTKFPSKIRPNTFTLMFFSALGVATAGWSASLVDMRPSSFERCYLLQFFHTVWVEMWA